MARCAVLLRGAEGAGASRASEASSCARWEGHERRIQGTRGLYTRSSPQGHSEWTGLARLGHTLDGMMLIKRWSGQRD